MGSRLCGACHSRAAKTATKTRPFFVNAGSAEPTHELMFALRHNLDLAARTRPVTVSGKDAELLGCDEPGFLS